MKRSLMVACALVLLAAPVSAQETLLQACADMQPQYSPAAPPAGPDRTNVENQFRYMCGQVVNAMANVQPTVGIAFSGGNPTLGTATTIGRRLGLFPRVSVSARVNAALAKVPDLLSQAQLDENDELPPMETYYLPVPALQGDVVVGLFNGIAVGPMMGGLGALDLLGSLSLVPAIEQTGLSEHIMNWGVGARVGILRQGLVMPGISVSGMYRNLGTTGFGDIDAGDPAEFSTTLSTISLRAGISKGILAFDFAAGAGYDIYRSDVSMDWELSCPAPSPCLVPATVRPSTPITGELETAAWNVFGNVGLSLVLLNLVGEVGYQKATDVLTAQDFEAAGLPDRQPAADDLGGGRFFGSIGVRLTL